MTQVYSLQKTLSPMKPKSAMSETGRMPCHSTWCRAPNSDRAASTMSVASTARAPGQPITDRMACVLKAKRTIATERACENWPPAEKPIHADR